MKQQKRNPKKIRRELNRKSRNEFNKASRTRFLQKASALGFIGFMVCGFILFPVAYHLWGEQVGLRVFLVCAGMAGFSWTFAVWLGGEYRLGRGIPVRVIRRESQPMAFYAGVGSISLLLGLTPLLIAISLN